MSEPAKREAFLSEGLQLFSEVARLLFSLTKQRLEGRDNELFIPLASCCNTALGIHKLLYKNVHTENEAYMLMRSLLEKLVNFHYLRTSNDQEVKKYFMHAYYRMYHASKRQSQGARGSLEIGLNEEARRKLKGEPMIAEALTLFSETNSRMNWTNKSFSQRLQIVCDKSAINEGILLLSSILTYSDASEVLHGSFYGSVFLTGTFTLGDFRDASSPQEREVQRNISMKLVLPLTLLSGLMIGTIQAIAKDHSYTEYIEKAAAQEAEALKILETTQGL